MSGLLRTITRRAAPVLRGPAVTQRANVRMYSGGPATEKVGAVESAVALGMFAMAILGPSGWILTHLEDYKKKE